MQPNKLKYIKSTLGSESSLLYYCDLQKRSWKTGIWDDFGALFLNDASGTTSELRDFVYLTKFLVEYLNVFIYFKVW